MVNIPFYKRLTPLNSAAILPVSYSLMIVFGHEERAGITTVVRLKHRPQNVTRLSTVNASFYYGFMRMFTGHVIMLARVSHMQSHALPCLCSLFWK